MPSSTGTSSSCICGSGDRMSWRQRHRANVGTRAILAQRALRGTERWVTRVRHSASGLRSSGQGDEVPRPSRVEGRRRPLHGVCDQSGAVAGCGKSARIDRAVGGQKGPVRVDVEFHAADDAGADEKLGQLEGRERRTSRIDERAVSGDPDPGSPLLLDAGYRVRARCRTAGVSPGQPVGARRLRALVRPLRRAASGSGGRR